MPITATYEQSDDGHSFECNACGFRSVRHPSKRAAEQRFREHKEEHAENDRETR